MSQRRSPRLFSPRRKHHAGCLTVVVVLFVSIVLTISLNGLSNRFVRLDTRRVTVLNLPRALEGFKILHLSDLNAASLGNAQENLEALLAKEAYQAVALTGDMVGRSGNAKPLLDVLALIPDDIPVFLIAGDSDPSPLLAQPHGDGEVKADYIRKAEAQGAIYLEAPYKLEIGGQTIWFCPGELFMIDLANAHFALTELIATLQSSDNPYESQTGSQLRHAQHRLERIDASIEAIAQMKPEDIIVALMHHPPDSDQLNELSLRSRESSLMVPSLFLAGQFNNGQVRLPSLGPVYIPRQADGSGGLFPRDEGFTGLSIIKGFPVHISPGLGVSSYYPIPIRLFNRPAVTIISLTAQMTR